MSREEIKKNNNNSSGGNGWRKKIDGKITEIAAKTAWPDTQTNAQSQRTNESVLSGAVTVFLFFRSFICVYIVYIYIDFEHTFFSLSQRQFKTSARRCIIDLSPIYGLGQNDLSAKWHSINNTVELYANMYIGLFFLSLSIEMLFHLFV